MTVSSLFALLVVVLLCAMAALNWNLLSTPMVLALGFFDLHLSLGLLLAAVATAVAAVFLLYLAVQQAGVIAHSRRSARELRAQRELADQAEASRIVELRNFLEVELRAAERREALAAQAISERLERMQSDLQERLGESTRTLSAYFGEVEDKLDRHLPPHG